MFSENGYFLTGTKFLSLIDTCISSPDSTIEQLGMSIITCSLYMDSWTIYLSTGKVHSIKCITDRLQGVFFFPRTFKQCLKNCFG